MSEAKTAEPTAEEKALLELWAKQKKLGDLAAGDEAGAAKRAKEEQEESSILHRKLWGTVVGNCRRSICCSSPPSPLISHGDFFLL